MRKHIQERIKALADRRSVQAAPIDIVLGGGTSLTFGVGSSDGRDTGESQTIRVPKNVGGQTSKTL